MDEYYDRCVALAKELGGNIIVAQRLKRLPTIVGKLDRSPTMKLSSMQDVAGVRVIAEDMEQLSKIEQKIREWDEIYKINDYIKNPKASGYRGKHFVIKKDGAMVEVQLRTQIEHIWATSVETVDVFRGTAMKTDGDKTFWNDFFRQASSLFAYIEEEPAVDEYSGYNMQELCAIMRKTMDAHKIAPILRAIEVTKTAYTRFGTAKDAYYLVLNLNFKANICKVFRFKEAEFERATETYRKMEKQDEKNHAIVLVSVNDIKSLDEVYPNYFMNLKHFNRVIGSMLEKSKNES